MQDIGGLRAVVRRLNLVRDLEKRYLEGSFSHELAGNKDYIENPKPSGYRSVHLVYRYKNDRAAEYNGLLVELQLRSRSQHAWATAVETMETFLDHALKSSEGPQEWLDFFALAGSGFAHLERTQPVPGYLNMGDRETFDATLQEAERLDVRAQLRGFTIAVNAIAADRTQGSFHLVELDAQAGRVRITSFPRGQLEAANDAYARAEERANIGRGTQTVLVSAGPIDALRRAYPNYFLDTAAFVRGLDTMSKRLESPRRARRATKKTSRKER